MANSSIKFDWSNIAENTENSIMSKNHAWQQQTYESINQLNREISKIEKYVMKCIGEYVYDFLYWGIETLQ